MKILIASPIDAQAVHAMKARYDVALALSAGHDELREAVRDREVIIFRSGVQITAEVMAAAPNLKLLIRAGSGVDNIDLEYVRRRGLTLVRIPEPGAKAVAELTFALMLALSRHLLWADALTRRGRWAKQKLNGYLITGKTLGIVGAGNIGSRVGQMGAAWGMRVLGCVEHPTAAKAARLQQKGIRLTHLREVLEQADFVCLHVPLKASTVHLIDADALALMKPSAMLVNMARGGVVDELALREALVSGHLRGAALDVHEREGEGHISPLADLPNVILTPHIGAMTVDSQREIGERILETLDAFQAGAYWRPTATSL